MIHNLRCPLLLRRGARWPMRPTEATWVHYRWPKVGGGVRRIEGRAVLRTIIACRAIAIIRTSAGQYIIAAPFTVKGVGHRVVHRIDGCGFERTAQCDTFLCSFVFDALHNCANVRFIRAVHGDGFTGPPVENELAGGWAHLFNGEYLLYGVGGGCFGNVFGKERPVVSV